MNKYEINYTISPGTLRFPLRETNRGVHAHFHAG